MDIIFIIDIKFMHNLSKNNQCHYNSVNEEKSY